MADMDEFNNDESEANASTTAVGEAGPIGSPKSETKDRRTIPAGLRVLLWFIGIIVVAVAIISVASLPGTTVFPAVILGALILRIGYFVLQQLATPPPPPPDPGLLRKVKLLYRCSLCGTEVRMTSAIDEDPEPPRHCMEDMDLVAPTME
ncbi:MAG TPA: hypothetical protein VL068_01955 [Microthrixaceae bacterium]|nr:hypothetical protein [Microthrixaceae bacterium]